MFSFLSFPANFDSRFDLLQNYVFLAIFNTDSAYDGLIFINSVMLAYQMCLKKDTLT